MFNWNVKVRMSSGVIQDVKVNNAYTRSDAERAALGSSGGVQVCNSSVVCEEQQVTSYTNSSNNYELEYELERTRKDREDEEYERWEEGHQNKMDKLEEEMYDLMLQIALSKGEELPTLEEFYEYIGKEEESDEEEEDKGNWFQRMWNKIF